MLILICCRNIYGMDFQYFLLLVAHRFASDGVRGIHKRRLLFEVGSFFPPYILCLFLFLLLCRRRSVCISIVPIMTFRWFSLLPNYSLSVLYGMSDVYVCVCVPCTNRFVGNSVNKYLKIGWIISRDRNFEFRQ